MSILFFNLDGGHGLWASFSSIFDTYGVWAIMFCVHDTLM